MSNPYYPERWLRVDLFEYVESIGLGRGPKATKMRNGRDAEYTLLYPYTVKLTVDGVSWPITVPEGFQTDLASVPWFARWFLGRIGPHLEAAIVHDCLYAIWHSIEGRGVRKEDRRFADAVFHAGMVEARVPWIQRNVAWLAVRVFGWLPYRKTQTQE